MKSEHIFKVNLEWKSHDLEPNNNTRKKSTKNHKLSIEGKPDIQVSAAKTFKGDAELYNPEDLLLSSLVSCHMMSFLYCCNKHKIEVISYDDNAEAILEVNNDGSGKITKVILHPKVKIIDETKIDLVNSLHKEANQLCFIANSCNFIVEHHAVCNI
ncbi:OsmC family protein [Chishuiella sp.]|uniref:OsmC family protein n=1 Tax=Chishuiella sp. TaxID=1969467 RepID=UPI0028A8BC33|nr:OsmC family protein [Chishuiella sp.]